MWAARDKDGVLVFYSNKPLKGRSEWSPMVEGEEYLAVDSNLFPEVQWEDPEPTEIILKK